MVGLGGLEPPASPLSGVRSNHLSYRPRDRTPEPEPDDLEPRLNDCVKYRCLVWTSCVKTHAVIS